MENTEEDQQPRAGRVEKEQKKQKSKKSRNITRTRAHEWLFVRLEQSCTAPWVREQRGAGSRRVLKAPAKSSSKGIQVGALLGFWPKRSEGGWAIARRGQRPSAFFFLSSVSLVVVVGFLKRTQRAFGAGNRRGTSAAAAKPRVAYIYCD